MFTYLQDFNETMDASRKARGKITPKKGIVYYCSDFGNIISAWFV